MSQINHYTNVEHDEETISSIVNKHLDLARKIAWHYHDRVNGIVEIEDLIQIGIVGLLEAINRYQDRGKDAFISYASVRIKGAIVDYLRRQSGINRNYIKKIKELRAAELQLFQQNNRDPDIDEIAEFMNIKISEIHSIRKMINASKSESLENLNIQLGIICSADDSSLQDPEESVQSYQQTQLLSKVIGTLDKRLQLILQLYYIEELNVSEIAKILHISTGRVSQLKDKALTILQAEMNKYQ